MGFRGPGNRCFWAAPPAKQTACLGKWIMRLYDVRYLRQELEEYEQLLEQLPDSGSWKTAALEQKVQRMADRIAEELWEIACYIAKIPDPELRLIFELRYFKGFSWSQVAESLPTVLSSDGVRMKHDRYLKKESR